MKDFIPSFICFSSESGPYYLWYYHKLQHWICFPGLLEVLVLSVVIQVSVATSITFTCSSLSYHECYLVCYTRILSFLVIFGTLCHILCSTMGAPHCLVTALFSTGNRRDLHFLARGHQSYHLHSLTGLKVSTYLCDQWMVFMYTYHFFREYFSWVKCQVQGQSTCCFVRLWSLLDPFCNSWDMWCSRVGYSSLSEKNLPVTLSFCSLILCLLGVYVTSGLKISVKLVALTMQAGLVGKSWDSR